jgi:paraquat-inducible protein B
MSAGDAGGGRPPEAAHESSPEDGWREPSPAHVRRSFWRWWIWSVPLAALILTGYLVTKHLLLHGPRVTVTFPSAEGVQGSGVTSVRYRGLKVGSVATVELTSRLDGVVLHLDLDHSLEKSLGASTRFWLETPSLGPKALSHLLAGPYIGIRPGGGPATRRFVGLLDPPSDLPEGPGEIFVLESYRLQGAERGTPVLYRGLEVGRVLGVRLVGADAMRGEVFVRAPYDSLVRQSTRFWRCGGIGLASTGGGFGLQMPPLDRLFGGCVAFDDFEGGSAPAAGAGTLFALAPSERQARHPLSGAPVRVAVDLPGSAAGLESGSAVELRGFRVGTVEAVELRIDPATAAMRTSLRLVLYPGPFGLDGNVPPAALLTLLDRLARAGMRAQLTSGNVILGSKEVSLVETSRRSRHGLDRSGPIPALPAIAGGDLRTVEIKLAHVAGEIDSIPFRRIGADVARISTRLRQVSESPAIDRSLANIDRALADIAAVSRDARSEVKPTLDEVRAAVTKLDSAATEIDALVAGPLGGGAGIRDLVGELTRTARSIRELAEYLDRHPEALLRGRSQP